MGQASLFFPVSLLEQKTSSRLYNHEALKKMSMYYMYRLTRVLCIDIWDV